MIKNIGKIWKLEVWLNIKLMKCINVVWKLEVYKSIKLINYIGKMLR